MLLALIKTEFNLLFLLSKVTDIIMNAVMFDFIIYQFTIGSLLFYEHMLPKYTHIYVYIHVYLGSMCSFKHVSLIYTDMCLFL